MQVEDAIGPDHVKRRIGTQLSPPRQAWHKPAACKGVGGRDPQRLLVAVALDYRDCRCKRFEPVTDDGKQVGPGIGQR